MPYSFIGEDDSKFTLSNGDGEFSIAKYGLDDGFMEKLRSLPRSYADGGMVEEMPVDMPVEDLTGTPLPLEPLPQAPMMSPMAPPLSREAAEASVARVPGQIGGFLAESIKAGLVAPTTGQQTAPVMPQATMTPQELVGPPRELMPSTVGTPTMPGYYEEAQKLAQADQAGSYALPSDMADAFRRMQQASSMDAQAKSDAALQQAAAMEEAAKDIQLEQVRYETKLRGIEQEREGLLKDYASGKIDPTRIYSNMNTGNRVMSAISVLLGGLSQGLTGAKSNPAMDVINNAIDRDIDAQKAELGKKQNLLAFNMQKYGNLKDAMNATKMQIMTLAQAQVNAAASKAGSKQALAAAQMFNADIDLKMLTLRDQLAASQAMNEKLNNPQGVSAKDLMKLNQDIQDKMVQLPNGNYIPAFNKESAKIVRDIQGEIYRVKDTVKAARNFMEQGASLPLTRRNDLAKTINQRILADLKSKAMLELGALTEADLKLLEPLVPSVGDFFQASSKQKLDQLDAMLNSKMNAIYSANVPGLNPSGRASRERSAFGGR